MPTPGEKTLHFGAQATLSAFTSSSSVIQSSQKPFEGLLEPIWQVRKLRARGNLAGLRSQGQQEGQRDPNSGLPAALQHPTPHASSSQWSQALETTDNDSLPCPQQAPVASHLWPKLVVLSSSWLYPWCLFQKPITVRSPISTCNTIQGRGSQKT